MVGQRENASCSRAGKVSQGQKRWLWDWGGWAGASGSWRNGPAGQRGEASRATCPRRIAVAGRASRRSSYGGDALSLSAHDAQRSCGELSTGVAALMWTSAAIIAFERRALPRVRSRFEPGEHGWASVAIRTRGSAEIAAARSPKPSNFGNLRGHKTTARRLTQASRAKRLSARAASRRSQEAESINQKIRPMRLRSTCTLYKDRSTRREGV